MKKSILLPLLLSVFAIVFLISPVSVSAQNADQSAGGLTNQQIQTILNLLQSFNVSQDVVNNVSTSLTGGTPMITALPPPAPSAFCYTFTRNLGVGTRGDDVDALVNVLIKELVLNNPGNERGNERILGEDYNEEIAAAVVRFQSNNNISPQSGFVGPLTRAKLNELYGCSVLPTSPSVSDLTQSFLQVSLAPTTPSVQNVLAGSSNVLVTALKFSAGNTAVRLQKIGLRFDGSDVGAVHNVSIWNDANQNALRLGTALFDGSRTATSTLVTTVTIPAFSEKILYIKVNLSPIGFGSTVQTGATVAINYNGADTQATMGVDPDSDLTVYSSTRSNTNAPAVTLVTSQPSFDVMTNSGSLQTGVNTLLSYVVTVPSQSQNYTVTSESFAISSQNVAIGQFELSSDAGPVATNNQTTFTTSGGSSNVIFTPTTPIVILAGYARTFFLKGTVSGISGNGTLSVTLNNHGMTSPKVWTGTGAVVAQPSITILAPNGGGNVVAGNRPAGQGLSVRWSSANLPAGKTIDDISFGLFDSSNNVIPLTLQKTAMFSSGFNGNYTNNGISYVLDFPIPANTAPGSYKFKVSCPNCGDGVSDASDNYFNVISSTLSPSISATAPTVNQTYAVGSSLPISWTTSNISGERNISIAIYNNNNTTIGYYVTSNNSTSPDNNFALRNDAGVYNWTIPSNVQPGSYKAQIVCRDCLATLGSNPYAWGPVFTITAPTAVAPTPTVTLRVNDNLSTGYQGPEVNLGSTANVTIQWSATNAIRCNTYGQSDLLLSDGTRWNQDLPTSGTRTFLTAAQSLGAASIGVQCWNNANGSDSKGLVATWIRLQQQPSITLSPASGPVGTTVTVQVSNYVDDINNSLSLRARAPATGGTSFSGRATNGAITFTVPNYSTGIYDVQLSSDANGNSNVATFTITAPIVVAAQPTVMTLPLPTPELTQGFVILARYKITAPASGDVSVGTENASIVTTGVDLDGLNLETFSDSGFSQSIFNGTTIFGSSPETFSASKPSGQVTFSRTPALVIPANQTRYFQIVGIVSSLTGSSRVISTTRSGLSASNLASAGPATVAPTPTITVTSPNGGEQFVKGQTYQLLWSSTNVERVVLDLVDPNNSSWILVGNLANITGNPGMLEWAVPDSIVLRSYKLRVGTCAQTVSVCSNDLVSVYDVSDSTFTIIAPVVVQPAVSVDPATVSRTTVANTAITPVQFVANPYATGQGPTSTFSATSAFDWQVVGSLPAGVTLTKIGAFAATLQGTPTTAGTYSFTVRATNPGASGVNGDSAVSIAVSAPVAPDSVALSIVDASSDKVGIWGVFAPGTGRVNGNNPYDFHWVANVTLSSAKTVRCVTMNSRDGWQAWSSCNPNSYPLVVNTATGFANTSYNQSFGLSAGTNTLQLYGQPETLTSFPGSHLNITFTDNSYLNAAVGPSSVTPPATPPPSSQGAGVGLIDDALLLRLVNYLRNIR